jgi:hypothetical protein
VTLELFQRLFRLISLYAEDGQVFGKLIIKFHDEFEVRLSELRQKQKVGLLLIGQTNVQTCNLRF